MTSESLEWGHQMRPPPLPDRAYLRRRIGKRRSGNQFYVRVAVPKHLRSQIGKSVIERSLGTTMLSEAKALRHKELALIQEQFEQARQEAETAAERERRKTITSADIEFEAQRYLQDRLAAIQAKPGDAFEEVVDDREVEHGLAAYPRLDELAEGMKTEEWDFLVEHEADRIAERYHVVFSAEQRRELCRTLQVAEHEALSRLVKIHEGLPVEPVGTLNATAANPLTGAIPEPLALPPRNGKGIRVSEAARAFIASHMPPNEEPWTKQTSNQAAATLRFFEEFTRNAPLQSITSDDVKSFLDKLSGLDRNYGRYSGHGKLTFAELLSRHSVASARGLSNKTFNRHLGILANMFDHAKSNNSFSGDNPTGGKRRATKKQRGRNQRVRRPFRIDELQQLFAGSLYDMPNDQRVNPAKHTPTSALAWLIPLALFTGARLDELCGLRVRDIAQVNGIRFFDIQPHELRRLKSDAAERRVPIHSELVWLGFLHYVESVRKQEQDMLFPGLAGGGPDDKRSWYISKKFSDYRKEVGAGESRTVFHSLRANVAEALENAGIAESEAARLLGHEFYTMSYGVYSGGLRLPILQGVVEAIRYPGLDLSRLYHPPRAQKARLGKKRGRQNKSSGVATAAH